jgi:hypothetical protein
MSKNRGLFISETKSAEKMNMMLEGTREELKQEQDLEDNGGDRAQEDAGPAGIMLQKLLH